MSRWNFMSGRNQSKPKKSIKELQDEIEKLKKAKEATKSYSELQEEKKRLQQEIRREGFKMKHKRALSIINKGLAIGEGVMKDLNKPTKRRK